MGVFQGISPTTALYLGSAAVSRVYVGATEVWSATTPPPGEVGVFEPGGLLYATPNPARPRLTAYAVAPDTICMQAFLGTFALGTVEPYTGQTGGGDRVGANESWWRRFDVETPDPLQAAFGAAVTTAAAPAPAASVDTASRWAITSSNHSGFGTKTPTTLTRKSTVARQIYFNLFPTQARKQVRHRLYLKINTNLQEGRSYTVAFTHPTNSALSFSTTFTFSEDNWSEAVHSVQEGFEVGAGRKLFFASLWLGNSSGAPTAYPFVDFTGRAWQVVNEATGAVAASGTLAVDSTDVTAHRYGTGPEVYLSAVPSWKGDFSALTAAGTYRVRLPGIGSGYPFQLKAGMWQRRALVTARAATYYQSASRDRTPQHAGAEYVKPQQHRPPGTVIRKTTARIEATSMSPFTGNSTSSKPYPAHPDTFGYLAASALAGPVNLGGTVSGGWDDAADWDSRSHGFILAAKLLDGYELSRTWWDAQDLVTDNPRAIPSTVPSILREIHNFLEFFRLLQVANNDTGGISGGLGVPGGVEYEEHPLQGETSYASGQIVYAYAASVYNSYAFAALAAQLAYLLGLLGSPPTAIVNQLTTAAGQAWLYAEGASYSVTANSVTLTAAQIRADTECVRLRAHAAMHLFRLTGTASYHTAFTGSVATTHYHVYWLYCSTLWPAGRTKDTTLASSLQSSLVTKAGQLAANNKGGFGIRADDALGKPSFPNNQPSTPGEGARVLAYAHFLTGTASYFDGIQEECHYGLGANPMNMCHIARLGNEWPQSPTEVDYILMGKNPTPGRCYFGINARSQIAQGSAANVRDVVWPHWYENWPHMEHYLEWGGSLAQVSEFGQEHLSAWPFVASYLAARA